MVRVIEPQWYEYGFEHLFEDGNRLFGGNSDNGGLANVNYNASDNRNDNIGFRLQIVFYFTVLLLENLFQAWNEFRKGKTKRLDVRVFERNLEDNLFSRLCGFTLLPITSNNNKTKNIKKDWDEN